MDEYIAIEIEVAEKHLELKIRYWVITMIVAAVAFVAIVQLGREQGIF